MDEMYYPMIEPNGHARAKTGNAMARFVESVISPNTEWITAVLPEKKPPVMTFMIDVEEK
jgi:hypothetical protein